MHFSRINIIQVKYSSLHLFNLLDDPCAMFTPQISYEEGTVLIVNSSMRWRNLKRERLFIMLHDVKNKSMELNLIQVKINCSTSGEETVIELPAESSCTALLQFHNILENEMKLKIRYMLRKLRMEQRTLSSMRSIVIAM